MAMTANDMARKRWKGVSKTERKQHSKMMAEARMATSTPEERSANAAKAAAARWAKKKTVATKKILPSVRAKKGADK